VSRADRLAAALEVDALLVTNPVNLRYLTGFTGSNGMAVVGRDIRRFITDFRYVEQAAEQVEGFDREQAPQDFNGALKEGWPDGSLRLGFEDDHVSVRRHARLRDLLPERVELVPAGGAVQELRAVKDAGEIEIMRRAGALSDEIFEALSLERFSGRTERELVWWVERGFREAGAENVAFPTVVAAGETAASPHADPGDRVIEEGVLVTVDAGCVVDGYCSDCTRTFAVGTIPDRLQEIYALCLEAQLAGLEAVGPGVSGRDADAAARTIIADEGLGEAFGHGLGHGVGIQIHEAPTLRAESTDVLEPGNVVSVEPGIYLPGEGGVRIEDLVLVTENGSERLTRFTKELVAVT
jgi:Xaa-Pro aminopeptidase